jgi:hypothetical protein
MAGGIPGSAIFFSDSPAAGIALGPLSRGFLPLSNALAPANRETVARRASASGLSDRRQQFRKFAVDPSISTEPLSF